MLELLKWAWHDPVWSKAIATFMIVLSGSIGAWVKTKWSERWAIKLTKTNCNVSYVPGIGYPLKYYVEMRNDSSKCIEVRVLNYNPKKISVKSFPPEVVQVRFHTKWYPTDHAAERVALLPGQMCRAWIGVDEGKLNEEQVKTAVGSIGTLIVSANGKHISFEL
jgi:hypothetical protein